jgi:hypothetical protein
MSKIKFKIANAGGGKTKWLVNKAIDGVEHGITVVFFGGSDEENVKFKQFYLSMLGMFPSKMIFTDDVNMVPDNSIVLVDNACKKCIDLHEIKNADVIYATLEGELAD